MKAVISKATGSLAIALVSMMLVGASQIDLDDATHVEVSDAEAASLVGGCSKYEQYPPLPPGQYYVCRLGADECTIVTPVQAVGPGYESEGKILCGACGLRYNGPIGLCSL